jgi:hypothetical protein
VSGGRGHRGTDRSPSAPAPITGPRSLANAFSDPGSIEIRFQDVGGANLLRWVSVTGYEYTCAYNQQTDEIEIHDRIGQGSVLHSFSNATPIAEVERIFSAL